MKSNFYVSVCLPVGLFYHPILSICLSVQLFVCLSIYFVRLSEHLTVCLSCNFVVVTILSVYPYYQYVYPPVCLSLWLSLCLSVCQSICSPDCLSICLFVYPVCMSISLNRFKLSILVVHLSVGLIICFSACWYIFLSLFLTVWISIYL